MAAMATREVEPVASVTGHSTQDFSGLWLLRLTVCARCALAVTGCAMHRRGKRQLGVAASGILQGGLQGMGRYNGAANRAGVGGLLR